MLKLIKRYGIILAIFGSITTGITEVIYIITNNNINNNKLIMSQKVFDQIKTYDLYYNNLIKKCYLFKRNNLEDNSFNFIHFGCPKNITIYCCNHKIY
ncbi:MULTISPECIES: hypothetical protein [Arsenophonus]|uniref:hypothetical protein n=1 Tax=Arsenophonus TaxID=637 RepID=UPI0008373268|nr:hypothetical protein [Candidatus Arsenophonus lipoptenae]